MTRAEVPLLMKPLLGEVRHGIRDVAGQPVHFAAISGSLPVPPTSAAQGLPNPHARGALRRMASQDKVFGDWRSSVRGRPSGLGSTLARGRDRRFHERDT